MKTDTIGHLYSEQRHNVYLRWDKAQMKRTCLCKINAYTADALEKCRCFYLSKKPIFLPLEFLGGREQIYKPKNASAFWISQVEKDSTVMTQNLPHWSPFADARNLQSGTYIETYNTLQSACLSRVISLAADHVTVIAPPNRCAVAGSQMKLAHCLRISSDCIPQNTLARSGFELGSVAMLSHFSWNGPKSV